MDKKAIILSVFLGVAANILYAGLLSAIKFPSQVQWGLIILLLFITPFLLLYQFRFSKYGLVNIGQPSDGKFTLPVQFRASMKSLCFMGVSARTMVNPHLERVILKKVLTNHEYSLRFLLFDRSEIDKLKRRAIEETGDEQTINEWAEVMHSTIQMLLRIKGKLGSAGDRLQIKTYKSFPVFRMIIVDDRRILLNHYAKNRYPTEMPYLELKASSNPATMGYAVQKYFEEVWADADIVKN